MRSVLCLFLLCALVPPPADAAPAPWYLWRSKVDGKLHCAQASPGPGWERERGPFRDIRCEKPFVGPRSVEPPPERR
ncbi:hypothetical protein [Pseudothauera rhizosphaerae]|uniref:DUF4124 domain-containing protein n=1 Tax=Pseudothauera rhizosphaerae TaxID=2565932 RepID=A0A4S4AS66_9RHOO|nr:hypothetical protein [Pseudothauera rhizosphaerae]THF62652.1 hypothetical protein E6O51_06750 [Pseudothauera rhizosphaerae]